ncbi:SDR family oxidoreductase [Jannaschia sp. LMIT008]|uniref:UDP-glucuronic acid decarboxylase family protein n=1 Tax=Jannaschia maritima TaxID=3032585 RepID=UPI0028113994|nr:SDR family oxidoreductase [Jannaschia sp. LMIT008]
MKRVLVSGGAGFLGSHLCDYLVREGHDVLCVDNYSSGAKKNIAHLLGRPNFEAIRHDVTHPLHVEIDRIYNLACPASPRDYQLDPVQTMKTSVIGAINMLGLAKRTGARILQTSTSEVYGEPLEHPQTETYTGNVDILGPRACYDEGKRCAETLFHDYRRQHGVDIRIVRLFNTYGPRMRANDGRVVSNFVTQALAGDALTIHGDGTQTRSFCYVDDMIRGIVGVMEAPDDEGEPINLGNPEEVTIAELARRVADLAGVALRMVEQERPANDPSRRRPHIGRADARIGWRPTVPLQDGLTRTIAYFRGDDAANITPLSATSGLAHAGE